MENLNAEKIYKELAMFIEDMPTDLHLGFKRTVKFREFLKDALALIASQEQKIFDLENRIKECENGYEGTLHLERCKLHDAEEKIKELDVELKAMRGAANSYKIHITELTQAHEMLSESYNHLEKTKDELLSERARITEENARLEKLCALRDQDNKDTQDLLYKAEAENDRLMRDKTALECIVETARNQAKVDTVRKMQERLTERLNRNSIFKGITMSAGETVYDVIDQIAKEMLEGKDENT